MEKGRLFEILYYLLQVKKTDAHILAQHFGVSTRTIYRDLDKLLVAGIPIMTIQGYQGGVYLDPHFVFDKSLFNSKQQDMLLAALSSLSSLYPDEQDNILDLISSLFHKESIPWIEIHFDHWKKEQDVNVLFHQLKDAILNQKQIQFIYCRFQGEKYTRNVYPVKLLFKSQSWYLQGYDIDRQDYRIFKLSRMMQLIVTEKSFDRSTMIIPQLNHFEEQSEMIDVIFQFDISLGQFVFDEFPLLDIEDKKSFYLVKTSIPYSYWTISYLLSFGSKLKIIEPEWLKEKLLEEIYHLKQLYEET